MILYTFLGIMIFFLICFCIVSYLEPTNDNTIDIVKNERPIFIESDLKHCVIYDPLTREMVDGLFHLWIKDSDGVDCGLIEYKDGTFQLVSYTLICFTSNKYMFGNEKED